MSALRGLLEVTVEHGPAVFLGATIVLAFGLLLARAQKTAAARRRLGIWTALACGVYLVIAAVPLPRLFADPPIVAPERPERVASATAAGSLPAGVTRAEVPAALAGERADPGRATPPTGLATSPVLRPPAATGTDAPAVTNAIDWSRLLAALYLGAGALLLAHHLLGWFRLRRILSRARPAGAALRAGLPGRVRLLIAQQPVRPFCAGWLRPVIVLSPELAAAERRDLRAAVLRHEAAHLHASDPLVQTLFALLALPLALHPLFWWLRADVRFHSELLADESAAGNQRTEYARELLDLVGDPSPKVRGTVAIFHRPSAFYRRIQMLLQPKTASSKPMSRIRSYTHLAAMFALVATTAGAFGVPAAAQDPGREAVRIERERMRAEIAALRDVIAQLRADIERNQAATAKPTLPPAAGRDPLRAAPQPLAGKPARPDLSNVVFGRLDQDGTFTPLPLPAGLPNARGPEPTPPGPDAPSPLAPPTQPTAGSVPLLSDIPTIGDLFKMQAATAGGQPPPGLPGAPSAPDLPATASSTEATVLLTTRLLDLETDVEIARAEFEDISARVEAAVAPRSHLVRAKAQLRNLERKRQIVRGLVDGEIAATKTEIQWLSQQLRRANRQTKLRLQMQLQRAEGRLDALRAAK